MGLLDPKDLEWLGVLLHGKESGNAPVHLDPQGGAHAFSYVKNPDGTVRWFFRSGDPRAWHLALYNATTLKGRIYERSVRCMFPCGLERLAVSGSFRADFSDVDLLRPWLAEPGRFEHVAFFSGTPGADRKVVVALGNDGRISHFLKIPLTPRARALVGREAEALARVLPRVPYVATVPEPCDGAALRGSLLLTSVRPACARRERSLSATHVAFLHELISSTLARRRLDSTPFFRDACDRIRGLSASACPKGELSPLLVSEAVSLLREVAVGAPADRELPFSFSHGDYTPWNTFIEGHRVHAYDWELAGEAPVLQDVFHFVCQTGVLSRRLAPEAILAELRSILERPDVLRIVRKFSVDVEDHFRLYLLDRVSYYLEAYLQAEVPHAQAHWLLGFWVKALDAYRAPARKPITTVNGPA